MTAGMIASDRVISRRSHGRMRKCRKPSIVICPASVPVIVELWPAQISAMANAVGASLEPSRPSSSVCASLDLGRPAMPRV